MKRELVLLLVFFAITAVNAESVSPERALSMAQDFMSGGKATFCASADVSLKLAYQAHSLEGKPDYYVFNRGNGGGYIVVTGDDRTVPVWGYSTSGKFDYESLPDNMKWWFSEFQRQLQYLRDNPNAKPRKAVNLTTSLGPLLTTKWNQCAPYNHLCPSAHGKMPTSSGVDYYVYHAATGCVPTALAQIMNYHKWPVHGEGSKSYKSHVEEYEVQGSDVEFDRPIDLSANFAQSTYRWNMMKDEYDLYLDNGAIIYRYRNGNGAWTTDNDFSSSSPNGAVAKLMSDVGIASSIVYGASERGGSSAGPEGVLDAMQNHFRYIATKHDRDNEENTYTIGGEWDQMLRDELDAGRPIFYGGEAILDDLDDNGNPKHARHAFVFHGYDNEGRFYVNWGWGGNNNEAFYSTLIENNAGYKLDHTAIFLEPNRTGKSFSANVAIPNLTSLLGGADRSTPLTVVGQNLDQDVSISVSGDASMFSTVSSISAAEANADEGKTVKLVYKPTRAGTHTAYLTLSAGDDVDPVNLTVTGNASVYCDADGDEQLNIDDLAFTIDQLLAGGEINYTGTYATIDDLSSIIDALLGISSTINVDDGLMAYYPFNGNANDMSGHGNDGIINNLSLTTGVNGDTNGAYQFGGYYNKGHIRIPNSESLKFSDGFTFACFVKPTDWSGMDGWGGFSSKGTQAIFAKSNDRNGPALHFSGNQSSMNVFSSTWDSGSKWSELNSTDKIQGDRLNNWLHVAVTYSKNQACMYIDGELVQQKSITPNFANMNSHDLYLGGYYTSQWWFPMNGVMDEVRIYNRALNAAEVNELAMDNVERQPFKLSKRQVTLAVGETVTVNMLNGSGSYSVGSNTGIVDFTLTGDSFTLTGTGVGTTNVTVIDVATQTTILLPVTVIEPTAPQTETFTVNGVSFTMVRVEGGTFMMGAGDDDIEANNDERPSHQVTLSSYSIGQTEVTQALWVAVMGNNPSYFQGDLSHPVEYVKWDDCQLFVTKLSEMTGREFRLPTEAEWEFAARGGNKSHGYKYSGGNNLNDVAWWGNNNGGNSDYCTHPVGTKQPNELGIYDMTGNVWEWCQDWNGGYTSEPQIDPKGPQSGSYRVVRGACWNNNSKYCRITMRYQGPCPGLHGDGMRLDLTH